MLPDLGRLAADGVPLLGLVALLLVAYRHPPEWIEAGVATVAAVASVLAAGLPGAAVRAELRDLVPVTLFLVAILLVAECCRAEGLFAAIGARLAAPRSAHRRFLLVFVAATAVTVALSLDATVALLTPVVLASGHALGASTRAGRLACVRLANSASLLLPVANLTNLLALRSLDLTFGRFALLMAPVWAVVLLVEYVGLRWWFRDDPGEAARPDTAGPGARPPLPGVAVAVVALMLLGFAVGSALGLEPFWVAGAAAAVLAVRAARRGRVRTAALARHAHLSFAVFVLGLGVVVAALAHAWLGDLLGQVLPASADLPGLLLLAATGAVLANLVNNLPATLVLAPLAVPLGGVAVLALLVGVNVGSSLTWTGSLANLLWRRSVLRSGDTVDARDFHGVALLVSPVAIVLGVLVLAGWSNLVL